MRMQLRAEPWPMGAHPPRPCPVCGEPWRPWALSRLPCHGKCLFTEEEQDKILADPRTQKEVAAALGVTVCTIRAAEGAAHRRKRAV